MGDTDAGSDTTPIVVTPPKKQPLNSILNSPPIIDEKYLRDHPVYNESPRTTPGIVQSPIFETNYFQQNEHRRNHHHQRSHSSGFGIPPHCPNQLATQTEIRSGSLTSQGSSSSNLGMSFQGNSNQPNGTMTYSHRPGHSRQPSMGRVDPRTINYCPYDGYCFVLNEPRCAICGEERSKLPTPSNGIVPPWRKVLFERQGFEDNYTDRSTFLSELKKNANVQEYSYKLVMLDSLVVTQQLSIVVLFIVVFMYALNSHLNSNVIGLIDVILALSGYIVWAICRDGNLSSTSNGSCSNSSQAFSIWSVCKLIGYSFGLYYLSPVLAALTDPISDDTITALSIILLVIHLSFQDYGYLNPASQDDGTSSSTTHTTTGKSLHITNSKDIPARARRGSHSELMIVSTPLYHAPVSLNAGIFASLMMASRLNSHNLAFVVIAFAVELFALFPIMAHHLKTKTRSGSILFVVLLVIFAAVLLHSISRVVSYIYIGTVLFATFGSPFCLQWIQRYKNEIHGPWDEAVPARARRHGTRQ